MNIIHEKTRGLRGLRGLRVEPHTQLLLPAGPFQSSTYTTFPHFSLSVYFYFISLPKSSLRFTIVSFEDRQNNSLIDFSVRMKSNKWNWSDSFDTFFQLKFTDKSHSQTKEYKKTIQRKKWNHVVFSFKGPEITFFVNSWESVVFHIKKTISMKRLGAHVYDRVSFGGPNEKSVWFRDLSMYNSSVEIDDVKSISRFN